MPKPANDTKVSESNLRGAIFVSGRVVFRSGLRQNLSLLINHQPQIERDDPSAERQLHSR
jgi:hypothetical protein